MSTRTGINVGLADRVRERYVGIFSTLDFGLAIRGPKDQERLRWLVQELKRS